MSEDEPPEVPPRREPRSRVDPEREAAALACLRDDRRHEALKILMTAYGPPLAGFAARILRDRELAKDVRQHVFLAAFERMHTFEGRGSLWSWLCRITYRRCLDELRKIRRAGPIEDIDVFDGTIAASEPSMDPAQLAEWRAVERCIAKLHPKMRTQLLMRYHLGMDYAEIGELVGDPHGTVQVRISRIMARLRRCVHGEGVER